jgi:hypothetical protein
MPNPAVLVNGQTGAHTDVFPRLGSSSCCCLDAPPHSGSTSRKSTNLRRRVAMKTSLRALAHETIERSRRRPTSREAVPIDLVASMDREHRSHDRLMLAENVAVALAELSLQSREPLISLKRNVTGADGSSETELTRGSYHVASIGTSRGLAHRTGAQLARTPRTALPPPRAREGRRVLPLGEPGV